MMLRRYIGRATGTRRMKKSWKFPKLSPLTWLILATGAMLMACVVVLWINPGSDVPGNEKGSQPSSGVTPESPSTPVSEIRGTT